MIASPPLPPPRPVFATPQDALLAVTRSLGWGGLRTCWLESCLAARSDHERYTLASESLRFVIANGGHVKAASFMLGVGGADANGVDSRLLSPLHLVALFDRPDIARVLLMCGASPRLVGGVTRTAAAARGGGKLWSPLDIAEKACTEGGALDEGERVRESSAAAASASQGFPSLLRFVFVFVFCLCAGFAAWGRCLVWCGMVRFDAACRCLFGGVLLVLSSRPSVGWMYIYY